VRCSKGKLRGMIDTLRDAFALQAKFCRQTGSPLTASVLEALIAVMDRTTRTGARILDWPGDPMTDALKLRIAGGLNALARSGKDPELTALYAARDGDWPGVIGRVLSEYDDWLTPWLDNAPQTNEVARSGVLFPGMMEIARRFGPRLEILELGASGGLNLNMDRFAYDLGGVSAGEAGSAVRIVPAWSGPAPLAAPVEIVARRGVDLNPLDMTDPAVAQRMLAYIWPDQTDRVARAEAAIAVARAFPPPVEAGDGAAWIERALVKPQAEGVTRVVYHSVALQYFPPEGRARVRAAIEAAGAQATAERPLGWLSMEFPEVVTTAHLTLRCWPGDGATQMLALAHPHGAHVEWRGGAP
jgi:hypothetical protein